MIQPELTLSPPAFGLLFNPPTRTFILDVDEARLLALPLEGPPMSLEAPGLDEAVCGSELGEVAAIVEGGRVARWDLEAGQPLPRLEPRVPATAIAYGQELAVGLEDGGLEIWRGGARRLTLDGHGRGIRELRFAPSGRLISICDAGGVCAWAPQQGAPRVLRGAGDEWVSLVGLDDERLFARATSALYGWDLRSGALSLRAQTPCAADAAYAPGCEEILVAHFHGGVDLLEASSGRHVERLREAGSPASRFNSVRDADTLLVACDEAASLWDARTYAPLGVLRVDAPLLGAALYAPSRLAIYTEGALRLYALPSLKPEGIFSIEEGRWI